MFEQRSSSILILHSLNDKTYKIKVRPSKTLDHLGSVFWVSASSSYSMNKYQRCCMGHRSFSILSLSVTGSTDSSVGRASDFDPKVAGLILTPGAVLCP